MGGGVVGIAANHTDVFLWLLCALSAMLPCPLFIYSDCNVHNHSECTQKPRANICFIVTHSSTSLCFFQSLVHFKNVCAVSRLLKLVPSQSSYFSVSAGNLEIGDGLVHIRRATYMYEWGITWHRSACLLDQLSIHIFHYSLVSWEHNSPSIQNIL